MPNTNYVKGRAKEYKITKELKDAGWDIVQRTAGSHSPIDVFAINKKMRMIKFIQSKPDNYPKSKADKIKEELRWIDGYWWVKFILR